MSVSRQKGLSNMNKICYVLTVPITVRAFFIPQLKFLSENGFDVTVICSSDPTLQDELGENVRFVPVDMPRGLSLFKSVSVILKLIKIFNKEKFDIVQYSTPNAALYSSIASKVCKNKVRNYHLMGFRYLGASGVLKSILKFLEKLTCKLSTSIECVSKSNLELGVKEGIFPREKATVVWNGSTGGVDLSRFDYSNRDTWRKQIREELGYSENDFIFGFVGRITKDKGIDELLEAYLQSNQQSKLLLVGDYENTENLEQNNLDKALNNKNIQFIDSVNDIERYYAAIDMLVLPSYREGFGNVIIEAGAMGTPAIVTDISGPKDAVIPNKTAFLVPKNDSNSLAKIFNELTFQKSKELGNNAFDFVKDNFDQETLNKHILSRKQQILFCQGD